MALIRLTLLLICAAAVHTSAAAQSASNQNGWYMYFGDHPVKGPWGVHLEGQLRRSDVILGWQQLLLRPALNFKVNKNLTLTGGYAYIRGYAYGELPGDPSQEHRIYQEANIDHKAERVEVEHRIRLEQRFSAERNTGTSADWGYANRVRYRLQGRIPLRAPSFDAAKLYIGLYDEAFVNWGAHSARTFDQNRAYGALGMNLNKEHKFELGYLHQYIPRSGGRREHNHTLQISLYSTLPFGRR